MGIDPHRESPAATPYMPICALPGSMLYLCNCSRSKFRCPDNPMREQF